MITKTINQFITRNGIKLNLSPTYSDTFINHRRKRWSLSTSWHFHLLIISASKAKVVTFANCSESHNFLNLKDMLSFLFCSVNYEIHLSDLVIQTLRATTSKPVVSQVCRGNIKGLFLVISFINFSFKLRNKCACTSLLFSHMFVTSFKLEKKNSLDFQISNTDYKLLFLVKSIIMLWNRIYICYNSKFKN